MNKAFAKLLLVLNIWVSFGYRSGVSYRYILSPPSHLHASPPSDNIKIYNTMIRTKLNPLKTNITSPHPSTSTSSRSLRRPRGYWSNLTNVRESLTSLWLTDLHAPVGLVPPTSPPIPSEHLLNALGRNDLRHAIVVHGGRESLSLLLGGAEIVPGRWAEAIEECEVVTEVVRGEGVKFFGVDGGLVPVQHR